MYTQEKRAILAVSFGTSHPDTCEKTIGVIEKEMQEQYPQYPLYRAWTSGMIRRKLRERDGIEIFSVREALEQMKKDGITEAVVQPTHMLNGHEYTKMKRELAEEAFVERTAVGSPLLTTETDCDRIVEILKEEWKLEEGEALVLMGHGTSHASDAVYTELNERFRKSGCPHFFLGTVEGYPGIREVTAAVEDSGVKKVTLAPFMIVAGDHVVHDMAGETEDSWKNIFRKKGYEVRCVLRGLGEYEGVRRVFLEHLQTAMEELNQNRIFSVKHF